MRFTETPSIEPKRLTARMPLQRVIQHLPDLRSAADAMAATCAG